MNPDISKLTDLLKSTDLSAFKNNDGNVKDVNDTNLFQNVNGDSGFDTSLLTRDGFIEALFDSNSSDSLTEDQLGAIYDALAELDGEDGMSEEELKYLAQMGNEKDSAEIGAELNYTINENDIAAFLEAAETADEAAEAAETADEVTDADCTCCDYDCECHNNPEEYHETITSVLKDDDRILTDDDGNNYVEVEPWSTNSDDNNCLSRIIANSYDLEAMGIEMYSDEYYALEQAVMDANPDIYGTEDGGWRTEVGGEGRENAVLYTGDKIILPDFEYVKCTCEDEAEETTVSTPTATTESTVEPTTEPTTETTAESMGTPNEPTGTPDEPTGTPNEPTGTPNEPTGTPNEPTGTPDEPTGTPNEPTGTPNEPTGTPDEPTGTPNEPTGTPNEPTGTPNEPTGTPNEPTGIPAEPTETPDDYVTDPTLDEQPSAEELEPADPTIDTEPDTSVEDDTNCDDNAYEDEYEKEEKPEL